MLDLLLDAFSYLERCFNRNSDDLSSVESEKECQTSTKQISSYGNCEPSHDHQRCYQNEYEEVDVNTYIKIKSKNIRKNWVFVIIAMQWCSIVVYMIKLISNSCNVLGKYMRMFPVLLNHYASEPCHLDSITIDDLH